MSTFKSIFNSPVTINFKEAENGTNFQFVFNELKIDEEGRSFSFLKLNGSKNTKLEMVFNYSRNDRSMWDVYEEGEKVARVVGDTKQLDPLFFKTIFRFVPRYDHA